MTCYLWSFVWSFSSQILRFIVPLSYFKLSHNQVKKITYKASELRFATMSVKPYGNNGAQPAWRKREYKYVHVGLSCRGQRVQSTALPWIQMLRSRLLTRFCTFDGGTYFGMKIHKHWTSKEDKCSNLIQLGLRLSITHVAKKVMQSIKSSQRPYF